MGFSDVAGAIDELREDIIELERSLVAIPALSPTYEAPPEQTGEARKVAFLKQYLQQHGFDDLEEIAAPDDRVPGGIRPNLIARVKGRTSARTTWIMAHTDVVPPGDMDKWTTEPFELKVVNRDRLRLTDATRYRLESARNPYAIQASSFPPPAGLVSTCLSPERGSGSAAPPTAIKSRGNGSKGVFRSRNRVLTWGRPRTGRV